MKMREFVNVINIDLKESPQQSDIKSIYDLESAIAIFNLKKILAANVNNEAPTSKKALEPFIVLLATRWDTIKDTDSIEQYNPNTPANKIFRKVAKLLGSSLVGSGAKFLMPTLRATDTFDNKDLLDAYPHEYVLNDGSSVAIEIFKCLHDARSLTMAKNNKEPKALCHTAKGWGKKELTADECARVNGHSTFTKEYTDKLATATSDELKEGQKKLRAGLEAKECAVNPGYGDSGKELLRDKLYSSVDSRDKLFSTMLSLPKELWRAYCKHIGVKKFIQIMSDGKMTSDDILAGKAKIEDILEANYLTGAKDELERCKIYCAYALYSEAKDNGIYYHGLKNMLAFWPLAYTDKSKLDSVEQLLESVLNLADLSSLSSKLTEKPLKQGVLGKFTMFTEQHLNTATSPQIAPNAEAQAVAVAKK